MSPTVCLRTNLLPWPLEPRESTEPEPRLKIRAKNGFFGLPDVDEDGERGEDFGVALYTDAEFGTCADKIRSAPCNLRAIRGQ